MVVGGEGPHCQPGASVGQPGCPAGAAAWAGGVLAAATGCWAAAQSPAVRLAPRQGPRNVHAPDKAGQNVTCAVIKITEQGSPLFGLPR